MATRYEPQDLEVIFEELVGENARAAIMVAGSLVELGIERMICSRLREPETSREKEVLFSDFGILGHCCPVNKRIDSIG
jgi:DNA-directed RNA polymerase subunit N (RpoN/RPB10)